MGNNTKHFDLTANLNSKTVTQLKADLQQAQDFVSKYPQFENGWHNEYVQTLKVKIAERIGANQKEKDMKRGKR